MFGPKFGRNATTLEKLVGFGYEVIAGSAGDFGGLIRDESRKWGEVVQASGAKGE